MKKLHTSFTIIGFLIITIISLTQCTPEELSREYPTVETASIVNITESGAVFNATINNINSYDIIEEIKVRISREYSVVLFGDASGNSHKTSAISTDWEIILQGLKPYFIAYCKGVMV